MPTTPSPSTNQTSGNHWDVEVPRQLEWASAELNALPGQSFGWACVRMVWIGQEIIRQAQTPATVPSAAARRTA
jgi:hypothetical protein